MKKFKGHIAIILTIFCLLGISFYWFSWRPSQIRTDCAYTTANVANESGTIISADQLGIFLDICLMKNGLKR